MFQSSFKLGRIRGIEIGVHFTWLLALGLIAWSLVDQELPLRFPRGSATMYWLIGVAAALLLFASVLIHELCHSFVAQALRMRVRSITLFMFGGVSNIVGEARSPRDEFLIAVVGPLSSLTLGGLFGVVWYFTPSLRGPAVFLIQYMFLINVALGIFNLVPGFPLDGGRVLRSILWATTGSMRRSTRWASLIGQLVGWAMIAYGVWRVFHGDYMGGLWMGMIGWFLNNAAEGTRRQSDLFRAFDGITVRDLMETRPAVASPELSVDRLVYDLAVRHGATALPVLLDDRLVGIVTLGDIRKSPQERWRYMTAGEVMTPTPLKVSDPGQNAGEALSAMAQNELNQLPVVQDGRLVGLVTREHLLRFMQMQDKLRQRGPQACEAARPLE